jgi:uncharacterized OB-fold protein
VTTTKRVPVVEGVFAETADGPRLLGSRCIACRTVYFPRSPVCRNPACKEKAVEDYNLSPRGKLWTYTVQYYKPPAPARFDDPFAPYGVGFIDLPEGIRVLSMMSTPDPESLRIGMDVELVLEALYHADDGSEVITWKFRPVAEGAGA